VVFGAVSLVTGLAILLNSPFFAARADVTTIYGNERVSADAIFSASGMAHRNLFRIDPQAAAAQIAELSTIASAEVRLRLPNEAIIEVSEYEPLLIWQAAGEQRWIATDGSIIPAAGTAPALVLVDESGVAADANGYIKPRLMEALLAIHDAYPQQTEVWFGALEGLYYRSAQGWTVYLGNGEGMSSKIDLLRATEEEITARGVMVNTIDLRFPDQAILK
jgi:cell division septal protein FtsQ